MMLDRRITASLRDDLAHTTPYFYRSSGGAEVDLLLARPGDKLWALEIKRSLSPKVARGFHAACDDLQPVRKVVVYPGTVHAGGRHSGHASGGAVRGAWQLTA